MTQKLVSVCIPTYNNAKYIEKTIRSVLNQTLTDYEIIVCDDNSTDNTVEIVSSILDPRIKIIVNEQNIGVFENWTKCIYLASGKYIKLLCGDDILAPECLKEQTNVLENDKNESIALVSCLSSIINAHDQVLMNRKPAIKVGINTSTYVYKKCLIIGTNVIGEPMVGMFRRKILEKKLVYASNKYLIDLDFWFKLLQFGHLFYINQNLASFRVSNDSLSSRLSFKQSFLFQDFAKDVCKTYAIPKIYLIPAYINSFLLGIVRNFIFATALKVKRKC